MGKQRGSAGPVSLSLLGSLALHSAGLVLLAWFAVRIADSKQPIRVTILGRVGDGVPAPAGPMGPPAPAMQAPIAAPPPPPPPKPRTRRATKPAAIRPTDTALSTASVPDSAVTTDAVGTETSGGTGAAAASGGGGSGNGDGQGGTGTGPGSPLTAYLSEVRLRIERAKRYPTMAKRSGLQGRVAVAFELTRGGDPQHSRVVYADHPLLGEAALQAVETAAPFPAFPPEVQVAQLRIEVPLRFTLEEQ